MELYLLKPAGDLCKSVTSRGDRGSPYDGSGNAYPDPV